MQAFNKYQCTGECSREIFLDQRWVQTKELIGLVSIYTCQGTSDQTHNVYFPTVLRPIFAHPIWLNWN